MRVPLKLFNVLLPFGQGVIELFFYLPVLMVVGIYTLPASALWVWIGSLPLCYLAASLLILKFRRMRYGVKGLLVVIIGGIHGAIVTVATNSEIPLLTLIGCSLLAIIIAIKGMSAQTHGWSYSFNNTQMLIGVMLYIAMQPLKLFLFKSLAEYNDVLIICGIATVILLFFFANERHLNSETVDSSKSSATLAFKRQNRFLIIIVVSLISVLALFRQIQHTIERFFHLMVERIMSWLNRPREQVPVEEPAGNEQTPQLPMEEAEAPSEWMLILEQILKIIGIVLLIAFVLVILYFVMKKVQKWAKQLADKLQERGADRADSAEGYSDEVESLMTLTSLKDRMSNRLKKLMPKKRSFAQEWSELKTNTEKIRYLYAHIVRTGAEQGYEVKSHMTPRETTLDLAKWNNGKLRQEGMQPFIEVYEEVRYGEVPPSDTAVDTFKHQFTNKK